MLVVDSASFMGRLFLASVAMNGGAENAVISPCHVAVAHVDATRLLPLGVWEGRGVCYRSFAFARLHSVATSSGFGGAGCLLTFTCSCKAR